MIGRLTGRLVDEEADGTLLVDVNGVGYELLAPLGTVGRAANEGMLTLHVHTHVREDAFQLFGFATTEDRLVFRTLLGISGVGPKTAVGVLSALSSADLSRAVAQSDLKTLTSVPGIGKKTAERLCLELRDKLLPVTGATTREGKKAPTSGGGKRDLLLSALTRMGYKEPQAQKAVQSLSDRLEAEELGVLIRESLAILSQ